MAKGRGTVRALVDIDRCSRLMNWGAGMAGMRSGSNVRLEPAPSVRTGHGIASKYMAAFIGASAVFVVMAAAGWYGIDRLRDAAVEMSSQYIVSGNALNGFDQNILRMMERTRDGAASPADSAEAGRIGTEVNALADSATVKLEAYRSRVVSSEERGLAETLATAWAEWRVAVLAEDPVARQNGYTRLRDVLVDIHDIREAHSKELALRAESDYRFSLLLIVFILVVGLAVGIVAFRAIDRSVSGPLGKIMDGLDVCSGRLHTASVIVSRSSGELAAASAEQASGVQEISASLSR